MNHLCKSIWHQNRFKNTLLTSLVTDEGTNKRANERMDGQTNGQVDNKCLRLPVRPGGRTITLSVCYHVCDANEGRSFVPRSSAPGHLPPTPGQTPTRLPAP